MRVIAALLLALAGCDAPPAEDSQPAATNVEAEAPTLALLTSLPLAFPEDGFSLESSGSPVLDALETRYAVRLIAAADATSLDGADVLLMAHAPAQTAEGLVELDEWVRAGGRVLLLADPRLLWESALPLGDRRRPLFAFPDTGLLGHWGVMLEGPDTTGPELMGDGDSAVLFGARGRLTATREACGVECDGLVALCSIGEGTALIIADADFIMVGEGGLDGPIEGNIPFLMAQLARL
ncbi:hypothetical protein [Sphingomicrobium marinum]|uniref:hypothetical protein n=1 Tax=Sphingomicrobium marinum TaxID=1227950 RepID=UPI00223F14AE|nr:hypothetical protein [Sphingomicrobium marinum]